MGAFINLIGRRFGKLTVVETAGHSAGVKHPKRQWACACDCGNTSVVIGDNLRSGNTTSCGCMSGYTTHGHTKEVANKRSQSPTYSTWQGMTQRCHYKSHSAYPRYGAKGITVCSRWRGRTGFAAFLADMGERPEGMTLDRKDGTKGYSKKNCRWATSKQQYENKRVVRGANGRFT